MIMNNIKKRILIQLNNEFISLSKQEEDLSSQLEVIRKDISDIQKTIQLLNGDKND